MKLRVDHYFHGATEAPPWAVELKGLIVEGLKTIMATVEELEPLVTEILSVVRNVSADTDKLLADLAAIPTAGLTPEQQGIVDRTVSALTDIRDRLKVLDSKVPDAA